MNLLCRFGIHDWTQWSEPIIERDAYLTVGYVEQVRYCLRCNLRKIRRHEWVSVHVAHELEEAAKPYVIRDAPDARKGEWGVLRCVVCPYCQWQMAVSGVMSEVLTCKNERCKLYGRLFELPTVPLIELGQNEGQK